MSRGEQKRSSGVAISERPFLRGLAWAGALRSMWPAAFVAWIVLAGGLSLPAQEAPVEPGAEPEQPAAPPIEISDEPKGIDPATLLPPELAAPVTVEFQEASLADVVSWLQKEQGIVAIPDENALADEGPLTGEPISDHLRDAPVYLLLDRLSAVGMAWHYDDGVVHITSSSEAEGTMATQNYNVGDLFDAGYTSDSLVNTITTAIAPTSWEEVGGPGSILALGDVLFISQTTQEQLQVAGLLAALREHGRRTYVYDNPLHEELRAALARNVTVDFRDVRLDAAIRQIAEQAGVDIRLDLAELAQAGIRDRQPVSLSLADQKLSVVLKALLKKLKAAWVIRHGALWITTQDGAEALMQVAVYDVRDLCRDQSEADALKEAITSQRPTEWEEVGGPGSVSFPLPGVMVVSQPEEIHDLILATLENYRVALRISKRRQRGGVDPKEVVTRYYRMPSEMASDLSAALPQLISPETWRSEEFPDAPGKVIRLASRGEVVGASQDPKPAGGGADGILLPFSVLVITQHREVHDALPLLIAKIEKGEPATGFVISVIPVQGGMGGGGMGGGGFGGGY